MRKIMLLLLLLCIAALPAAGLAQARGFETPEACAEALFAAIKAQDVGTMEECIAFDELAAGFDFQAQAERLGAVIGNLFTSYLPANSAFAIAFNRTLLMRDWYGRLAMFGLTAADSALAALKDGYSHTSNSAEYAAVLEAANMEGAFNIFPMLEYKGVVRPGEISSISEAYNGDRTQENLRRIMAIWQVSGYEEIGILFSTSVDTVYTEGAQYIIPLRLIEVNGRWLADPELPVFAYLMEMSATDFVIALP